jgi:flagellar biosynthesis anti-sigma factor FlgM
MPSPPTERQEYVMKIDPRIQLPDDAQSERVKGAGSGAAQTKASSAASGVSAPSGEDTVRLSSTHAEVHSLAAQLSNVPEVRVPRVAALQQRIRSGNFAPDPQQVADAIVADHSKQGPQA